MSKAAGTPSFVLTGSFSSYSSGRNVLDNRTLAQVCVNGVQGSRVSCRPLLIHVWSPHPLGFLPGGMLGRLAHRGSCSVDLRSNSPPHPRAFASPGTLLAPPMFQEKPSDKPASFPRNGLGSKHLPADLPLVSYVEDVSSMAWRRSVHKVFRSSSNFPETKGSSS